MNIQDWFPLGFGLISLLCKGLLRFFSSTTILKRSSALSLLYGPTLASVHDFRKHHNFDYKDLCWQSNVSDFNTLSRFVAQAPLSMEFSMQEYWSRLPFLLQGISCTTGRFFTTWATREAHQLLTSNQRTGLWWNHLQSLMCASYIWRTQVCWLAHAAEIEISKTEVWGSSCILRVSLGKWCFLWTRRSP